MASFLTVCRFTPTAGGTTDWTYSSAVTGYQSPTAAGAVDGKIYRYRAESFDLSQWEVGYGAWTTSGTVLARTTVLYNSSGTTSKISFSAAPQVAIVFLAEDVQTTYGLSNHSLAVSAGSSALTIALKDADGKDPSGASPVTGWFRNVTGTTGSWTQRQVTSALSLVVSSGSTLGVTSSTAFRLWVVLFDDGGTMRLGVINCSTSTQVFPLNEGVPTSSTAEGGAGAADSAGVIYTGTAVTSKSFLIVGYVEWNTSGVTAGTWTTSNVNFIQSFGPGIKKPGDSVQVARTGSSSVATGTTQIPNDNTIPQNTEGDQYMSQAITPTSAANLLRVESQGFWANSAAATSVIIAALFQDSTANALATTYERSSLQNGAAGVQLDWLMRAGTTSSTTFKVRAGTNSAVTTTFNGENGTGQFNATYNSYIQAEEIQG